MVAGGNHAYLGAVFQFYGITGTRNGLVKNFNTHKLLFKVSGFLVQEGFLTNKVLFILAEHPETRHDGADFR